MYDGVEQLSTVEIEHWPTGSRTLPGSTLPQQKLASAGGVAMAAGDVISMETTEAACHGDAKPHREHGQF